MELIPHNGERIHHTISNQTVRNGDKDVEHVRRESGNADQTGVDVPA
jgi:hypothetical protein